MKNQIICTSDFKFYNYIYLDSTKPGRFTYPGLYISFLYEPFYVGKGTKKRYISHIEGDFFRKSVFFQNKIFNIARNGDDPEDFILILNKTDDESLAYRNEEFLIRKIKRNKDGGSLLNKMFKPSKNHMSEFMKDFNPMFSIPSSIHSRNVKNKQWSGIKGDKRRKEHSIRLIRSNSSRKNGWS